MYQVYVDGKLFSDPRVDDLALINPVVTLQANAAGTFEFTIPNAHPYYDLIKRKRSIIKVVQGDDIIFQGVAATEKVNFLKNKTIGCEGELTYLNDSVLRPAFYQNKTVRQLMEAYIAEHNAQVEEQKRFEVGMVEYTDTLLRYTNYNNTLTELKEDLLENFGGYLRIRYADGKNYLDYIKDSTRTSSQKIELGKNLLDYVSNIDDTNICTAVIPLGARLEKQEVEGLDAYTDIRAINGGKDYVFNQAAVDAKGWITKVIQYQDVTDKATLKRNAERYLKEAQFDKVMIEVSAVDLGELTGKVEAFRLMDRIRVISAPHGMDKDFMLAKMTIYLNEPGRNRITLGAFEQKSLSAKTAEAAKKIERAPKLDMLKSMMDSAAENATRMLTGADGGYVHIIRGEEGSPEEICITDEKDINKARRVWRWNQNGLGYSSTGIDGPYGLAMTMDGGFVADFIKSGTIRSVHIYGSTIIVEGFVRKNAEDYTQADLDRVNAIILEQTAALDSDYEKYDLNGDGIINALDLIKVNNLVTRKKMYEEINTSVTINGEKTQSIIKTAGVSIGSTSIRTQSAAVKTLYPEKIYAKEGQYWKQGVTGSGTRITCVNGIVTSIS